MDAVSDDGLSALTLIAFVGSVFSPYYARARRHGQAMPEDFCALNVALYGGRSARWAMTERGCTRVARSASEFQVGPSRVRWQNDCLTVDVDEWSVPLPRRVRGQVRVHPIGITRFHERLDPAGLHRWGPIAPSARVEVAFEAPSLSWSGHGYLDSNEGDEAVDVPFEAWDWSRTARADGTTDVVYDVRQRDGAERLLAVRFRPDGAWEPFEAPPRQPLPATFWRVPRAPRVDPRAGARVVRTLEDTPFYTRSLLSSVQGGAPVASVHESLSIPRLTSPVVQFMLPFRMPRRR